MTEIEQAYVERGYALPSGWTWPMVAIQRVKWDISPIFVPVANAAGCVAWGVPHLVRSVG